MMSTGVKPPQTCSRLALPCARAWADAQVKCRMEVRIVAMPDPPDACVRQPVQCLEMPTTTTNSYNNHNFSSDNNSNTYVALLVICTAANITTVVRMTACVLLHTVRTYVHT